MISTFDIHWAAGFLEGEGSFYGNGPYRTPTICAPQKDRAPLERLVSVLGGSIHKRGTGMLEWKLSGIRAAGAMMTVYGLMSPRRREQIRSALEVWKTRRPRLPKGWGWRTRARPERGKPMPEGATWAAH